VKRAWVVWGWLAAMLASALPALWATAQRIAENPLGKYVDPATGAWLPHVYGHFFTLWLPVAAPVSVLAFACLFLNRPEGRR